MPMLNTLIENKNARIRDVFFVAWTTLVHAKAPTSAAVTASSKTYMELTSFWRYAGRLGIGPLRHAASRRREYVAGMCSGGGGAPTGE